jgi:spermidine dehydrogenase
MDQKHLTHEEVSLGMSRRIARRDLVNGALVACGLSALAPKTSAFSPPADGTEWDGYGGIGDYKDAHGNTWDVVEEAHKIRDGVYDKTLDARDTGEVYDLVIVGGGSAGLGAAYFLHQSNEHPGRQCLILENHSIFGGEAKHNEFLVNGQRLIGPQGAWRMVPEPDGKGGWMNDLYRDIRLRTEDFHYQAWDKKLGDLEFERGQDFSLLLPPKVASFGYFFDQKSHGVPAQWVRDLWRGGLDKSPWPDRVRRDLWESVFGGRKPEGNAELAQPELERWLDSISYQEYLERYMGLDPEVTRFVDPMPACIFGLGADAISALNAYGVRFPGFHGLSPGLYNGEMDDNYLATHHAFPGGNSNTLRHLAKFLIPESIPGPATLDNIHNQHIRPEALDREQNSTRIRVHSTVVRVEHLGKPENADFVQVTYTQGGKLWRLRARHVVMASGGWVNRHIVRDLPDANRAAYTRFHHSSTLVANVALTNWRFLHKLGITGGRWFDGLGYTANIRQQMIIGDYAPRLHPDSPNVMTFYIPFYAPGKPIAEQVASGRAKLFGTSFREYERQIRESMVRMFGTSGFDAKRDIAGIILNRWGHSLVVPEPGFRLGKNGAPPDREIARKPYGRISFAHSELEGGQYFGGAMIQARQAIEEMRGKS